MRNVRPQDAKYGCAALSFSTTYYWGMEISRPLGILLKTLREFVTPYHDTAQSRCLVVFSAWSVLGWEQETWEPSTVDQAPTLYLLILPLPLIFIKNVKKIFKRVNGTHNANEAAAFFCFSFRDYLR